MKFTGASILFSAAYLASIVSAQIISVTSPLSNTKYKAGQEAIISWVGPKVPTISQIVLAKGPATGLQPVLTIATNVNASDMKYVWKIPMEIENGNDYAFEFGTSPDLAFAGPFIIEGSAAGASSSSNSTTSSNSTITTTTPVAPAPVPVNNATPAAPSTAATTATSTTSQTTTQKASTSSTSAANKQVVGQTIVALGLVAAAASQFL